jgi:MFS family permease
VFGLFWGAWGAALPAVQVRSGSTDGELGAALLMIGLGALLSMRLTGRLVDRFGAGVLPVVMTVFAAAGVLPAFAGSPAALSARRRRVELYSPGGVRFCRCGGALRR